MGILVECPKCKVRGSVKRKVCKCRNQVQKSDSKRSFKSYHSIREIICKLQQAGIVKEVIVGKEIKYSAKPFL